MLVPSTSVVARSAQSRDPWVLTGSRPAPIRGAQPEGTWRAHYIREADRQPVTNEIDPNYTYNSDGEVVYSEHEQ
jgi:hypothetical protein